MTGYVPKKNTLPGMPPGQRLVICEVKIQTDLPATTLESLTLWSRLFQRLGVASATYVIEAKTRKPKLKHPLKVK